MDEQTPKEERRYHLEFDAAGTANIETLAARFHVSVPELIERALALFALDGVTIQLSPEGKQGILALMRKLNQSEGDVIGNALGAYHVMAQLMTGPGKEHLRCAVFDPNTNTIHQWLVIGGINKPPIGLVSSDGRPL